MRDAILTYFAGEKHAALLLIAAGVVTAAAAAGLFPARWGLRSLAITLGVFAVLYLALGIGLHVRTGPQVGRLLQQLGSDAAAFGAEETARMAKVQRNFVLIEYVEVALAVVSVIAALAFKSRSVLVGVAVGLAINAAFLLAFDLVAERRGAVYLTALEAPPPPTATVPGS